MELLEKRAFDLLFASIALLLLTPVLAIVALLIKLDSAGPVFFLQHRFGFNQKPFRIIKFRTMRTLDDGRSSTRRRRATRASPAWARGCVAGISTSCPSCST
jgi:lipopolysaccharide/colanic/teichoic acid biosynthesis glycosyltransferase